MIKSHVREKLINAAVFFAENTNYCGKIKLIKLLYLLDFEHFRQTGHSVTGMDYHALKMGPVPMDFYQEWDDLGTDFSMSIEIVPERVIDYVRERVQPKQPFDESHFSRRELKIMNELTQRFKDDYSKPMVNVTHEERGPWAKIWDDGRGERERIPYSLAVADNDPNRDAVLEAADQYQNIVSTIGYAH
jgi:uncharacterized phage-associated protein